MTKREMGKTLGGGAVSIGRRSDSVSLSTLCFCINSVCMKGQDIWLGYPAAEMFAGVIRVILFDRAVTHGCRIKRHFVFFSSLTLAQPRLHRAEARNRADDRQVVEKPAVWIWPINIWDVPHQRINFSTLALEDFFH